MRFLKIRNYTTFILSLSFLWGCCDCDKNIDSFPALKISKKDAFKQYIAYHEGWGNYKNYKKNQKIILLAKKVENQSNKYKNQLAKCSKSLTTRKYIIF